MQNELIFDKTHKYLEKSMDVSARRHSLITGNIANIDTVGYKPKDLDFQETLKKEMGKEHGILSRTHTKHFRRGLDSELLGAIRVKDGVESKGVDIDTEMTSLLENNIKYRTSIEMLLRKIGILRQAISEGGR